MPIIRERLSVAFPRFQALADMANAGKHLELDRGPRTGLAAQHFQIGQGAAFSDGTHILATKQPFPMRRRWFVFQFKGATIDVLGLCEAALAALEGLT
ncbi:hypothetical protein [Methylocystis sp.]|jgi:hypothetical protein|uniref:hypothetical protein n=1 Tax=Methylocystis sp. TaxID=1911079 RepID=UPI0027375EC6|nr:hypothetical protein [Methylocystis sp.]MDP3555557.1 hypothetical protein [Methylocystis sp.]